MTIQDILRDKGTEVHSIGPDATLGDVVRELVRLHCGSMIVFEPASGGMDVRMIGIITERDILRAQAAHRAPLENLRVAEAMSDDLITATPGDPIEVAMELMTVHRIRHLPVVERNRLLGIVSIGDIVKAQHDRLQMENHYMSSYIRGEVTESVIPPVG